MDFLGGVYFSFFPFFFFFSMDEKGVYQLVDDVEVAVVHLKGERNQWKHKSRRDREKKKKKDSIVREEIPLKTFSNENGYECDDEQDDDDLKEITAPRYDSLLITLEQHLSQLRKYVSRSRSGNQSPIESNESNNQDISNIPTSLITDVTNDLRELKLERKLLAKKLGYLSPEEREDVVDELRKRKPLRFQSQASLSVSFHFFFFLFFLFSFFFFFLKKKIKTKYFCSIMIHHHVPQHQYLHLLQHLQHLYSNILYSFLLPLLQMLLNQVRFSSIYLSFIYFVCIYILFVFSLSQKKKKGYIVKLGGTGAFKNWRKRWFVLHNRFLYYYKTPSDNCPVDRLEIQSCTVKDSDRYPKRPNLFSLSSPLFTRTYYLSVESPEEKKSWMESILTTSKYFFFFFQQFFIVISWRK